MLFLLAAENPDSQYSYCSLDDGLPEFISTTAEELPKRWQAPECLLEHRYSTASDVWAFGVLMYEVLTYGCGPYRNVPIDDEVISQVSVVLIILKDYFVSFVIFMIKISNVFPGALSILT